MSNYSIFKKASLDTRDLSNAFKIIGMKWIAYISRFYPKRFTVASHSPVHTPTAVSTMKRFSSANPTFCDRSDESATGQTATTRRDRETRAMLPLRRAPCLHA